MSLKEKPSLMDFRILMILQITIESDEFVTSHDVLHILRSKYQIKMNLREVVNILDSLVEADYLLKYSPSGLSFNLDTEYYLGPKLPKSGGVKYDSKT